MVAPFASVQSPHPRRASVSFVEFFHLLRKGTIMDRTTAMGGSTAYGGNSNPASTAGANLEGAAQSAHRTVDAVADKTTEQVGRVRDKVHRAANSHADA